ncbi:hypothetical protein [Methanosarcina sp. Kolksee]|uniref:hypothetical protein n=1 Tax=Methanosarcina sp. Kolksee TaxID=1434099 RepID=UPI00064FFAAA
MKMLPSASIFIVYACYSKNIMCVLVKSHGIERYGKGNDRLRQVRALETNANGSMLTCRNLDDVIKKGEEFLSKPIEHEIPSLFVDATCLKVRNGLHYKNTNNI